MFFPILKGKYQCTADIFFILLGFSYFDYVELASTLPRYLFDWIQTGGQPNSDTSPYGKCYP